MAKIYEPKGKAREYSPLALNYIKGCDHGCLYCYVTNMMKRFNSSYNHKNVDLNVKYKEIENSARKYQGIDKQILFMFTSDPYCNSITDQTRKVLEILNFYNHKVAILTKGGKRCLKDIEVFKKFGSRIKVGATLTFDNDKDSKYWEPGAALPAERIEALKIISESNIKTWVSFEPVIVPEQTLNLIKQVSDFIDFIKIGKLNNYRGLDKKINWSYFLDKAVEICRKENINFYIKKDLAAFNKNTHIKKHELNQDFL